MGLQAPDLTSAQVIVCPSGVETPQPDFGIDVGDPEAVDQDVRRFFAEDPDGHVINVLAHLPDAT